jgi:hypothetical protein
MHRLSLSQGIKSDLRPQGTGAVGLSVQLILHSEQVLTPVTTPGSAGGRTRSSIPRKNPVPDAQFRLPPARTRYWTGPGSCGETLESCDSAQLARGPAYSRPCIARCAKPDPCVRRAQTASQSVAMTLWAGMAAELRAWGRGCAQALTMLRHGIVATADLHIVLSSGGRKNAAQRRIVTITQS